MPNNRWPAWRLVDANGGWAWLEDYAAVSIEYEVFASSGRLCQIGAGLFVLREPRGEKIRFTGTHRIRVFGIGALHVRVLNGNGTCWVGLTQVGMVNVPVWAEPTLTVTPQGRIIERDARRN
jgi:hypothetical protein